MFKPITPSRVSILVGRRIKYFRTRLNISQEALGLEVNQDQSYIYKVEHGKVNISLRRIVMIANVLKVDPCEFFK